MRSQALSLRSLANLHESYDGRRRRSAFHAAPTIGDAALILGRGSLLARSDPDVRHGFRNGDDERLTVLLTAAYGREASPLVLHFAKRASLRWRRGEAALAHIELAFARLPRLATEEDAFRLFLAEALLDDGLAPQNLARHLGLLLAQAPAHPLVKYDPDQPRVPAGSGRASGQWGSAATEPSDTPQARTADALPVAARSLLIDASPAIVRALAVFASRFAAPTAVLGALIIPTPNSGGVTEGTLPGAADIRYRRDGPAGILRLAWAKPDGDGAVVVAHSRGGIYYDAATDEPLGRDLGEQLYLDLAAVEVALARRGRPRPAREDDGPQLCPKPEIDKEHNPKGHVLDYEDDVHRRVNPLAPLPRGFAVRIVDPETGEWQYPDDCFRYAGDLVDGDMRAGDFADAKGEEYARLLTLRFATSVMDQLVDVTERHRRAARTRGARLKVYFAEQDAANLARQVFNARGLGDVAVGVLPPSRPKRRTGP